MIGGRTRSRELALQSLYSWDMGPEAAAVAMDSTLEHAEASAEVRAFAKQLAEGVLQHLPAIDAAISAAAENWSLKRLAAVDRNVLRLAVYELTQLKDVPPAVAIDEAIELGKRYSTRQSGAFVNGVLDRIRRDLGIEITELPAGDAATAAPTDDASGTETE